MTVLGGANQGTPEEARNEEKNKPELKTKKHRNVSLANYRGEMNRLLVSKVEVREETETGARRKHRK